jgi:hypothetical protein
MAPGLSRHNGPAVPFHTPDIVLRWGRRAPADEHVIVLATSGSEEATDLVRIRLRSDRKSVRPGIAWANTVRGTHARGPAMSVSPSPIVDPTKGPTPDLGAEVRSPPGRATSCEPVARSRPAARSPEDARVAGDQHLGVRDPRVESPPVLGGAVRVGQELFRSRVHRRLQQSVGG